jgi:hypothetical protein
VYENRFCKVFRLEKRIAGPKDTCMSRKKRRTLLRNVASAAADAATDFGQLLLAGGIAEMVWTIWTTAVQVEYTSAQVHLQQSVDTLIASLIIVGERRRTPEDWPR